MEGEKAIQEMSSVKEVVSFPAELKATQKKTAPSSAELTVRECVWGGTPDVRTVPSLRSSTSGFGKPPVAEQLRLMVSPEFAIPSEPLRTAPVGGALKETISCPF